MSLTRLALRLASIAAVKASPALAGTKVHDTGWSKFERVGEGDYSPVIIISTEDVSVDEEVSRHEVDRRVDLLFQIALATVDGELASIAPDDWDTAEALLDVLEQEIDWALERDLAWSRLVQHAEHNSTVVRDASGVNKMPVRLMVKSCRVFAICAPPPAIAPAEPAAGLDRWGQDVANIVRALPPGDRVRTVLENAASLTVAEQVQRLAAVKVTARPTGKPAAPDDTPQLVLTVEIPPPPTP
jgi:hypothetical protein